MLDCGEGKLHTKVNNFKRWAKANYPEVQKRMIMANGVFVLNFMRWFQKL